MFNYPQPQAIPIHNKYLLSTHNIISWWNKICFEQTVTKHIYLIIVVLFLALTVDEK